MVRGFGADFFCVSTCIQNYLTVLDVASHYFRQQTIFLMCYLFQSLPCLSSGGRNVLLIADTWEQTAFLEEGFRWNRTVVLDVFPPVYRHLQLEIFKTVINCTFYTPWTTFLYQATATLVRFCLPNLWKFIWCNHVTCVMSDSRAWGWTIDKTCLPTWDFVLLSGDCENRDRHCRNC